MPAKLDSDVHPSPEFLEIFRAEAGSSGTLPFDRFMDLALYHPAAGYYRADRQRVGYGKGTDFFTSSSTGVLFGELVHAACCALLGKTSLADFAFVELGTEPDGGVLRFARHTFGSVRTVGIGKAITLSGPCVFFSNELFDAQPFRRFRFRAGRWRELGVGLNGSTLVEIEMPDAAIPATLPSAAPEGYLIDFPHAAAELVKSIAQKPWSGLFLAFDYGKSWRELAEAAPAGTARAYHQHRQSNDLLARPGRQDLTCHICWDWLRDALKGAGFAEPQLETQEAFLIRRAATLMSETVAAEAATLGQRKLALIQLLQNLGQKFQVLWALRQN